MACRMAVCGHCWVCGGKFDCAELRSCGDCTTHKPLETYREGDECTGLRTAQRICGLCERDIDSGAIGSLVEALRTAVRR